MYSNIVCTDIEEIGFCRVFNVQKGFAKKKEGKYTMAALSKYYSEIMKNHNVNCAYVLHPSESCTYFLLKNLPITLFRVSQFFVPLYFVSGFFFFKFQIKNGSNLKFKYFQLPMLANSKKLNKEKVYEVLEVFVTSVIGGASTVRLIF